MKDEGVRLVRGKKLDQWLIEHVDEAFPICSKEKGELPYPERYKGIERSLLPIQRIVEKAAMAISIEKQQEALKAAIKEMDCTVKGKQPSEVIKNLFAKYPIDFLNDHGPDHVAKVIEKVSDMLCLFEDEQHLSPYEGFFLLCAIQVHDVGNVFGREGHSTAVKRIMDEFCEPVIKDNFERNIIEKLAAVHGGEIGSDKDTICRLKPEREHRDIIIRKRLLAALLRFGDELADDSTRANRYEKAVDAITPESAIHHRYSEALHTVNIIKDKETKKNQIKLGFGIESDLAKQLFEIGGKRKYLLDEIYDRTLKMERERRYCMRFIRPCLSIERIKVEIVIQHSGDTFCSETISYTLEEKGYPSSPTDGRIKDFESEAKSGKEIKKMIKEVWGA